MSSWQGDYCSCSRRSEVIRKKGYGRSMSYKILIVDDEEDILQLLKDYFELQDYLVMSAKSGKEAIEKASKGPDIILLDINMPEIDGFEVCRRIRFYVGCPIIFVTAKVEEQDLINGLMIGGDDYIIKPFSMEELGARVKAHLRREQRHRLKESILFSGNLTIHYGERAIYYENMNLNLTKTEFDIVLWDYDSEGDSNIITEHIRRIRGKLKNVSEHLYIDTVWGVGYKWIG